MLLRKLKFPPLLHQSHPASVCNVNVFLSRFPFNVQRTIEYASTEIELRFANIAWHFQNFRRRGVNEIKVKAQMERHKSEEETSSSQVVSRKYTPPRYREQCLKRVKTHLCCWRRMWLNIDGLLKRMIARRRNVKAFGWSIIIGKGTYWTEMFK